MKQREREVAAAKEGAGNEYGEGREEVRDDVYSSSEEEEERGCGNGEGERGADIQGTV